MWVSACQGQCPPKQFERARVVVFAGTTGWWARGIGLSRRGDRPDAGQHRGRRRGHQLTRRDCGRDGSGGRYRGGSRIPSGSERYKIRRSSGNIAVQDALSHDETVAAVAAGRRIADEEVDAGADLLIAGDMGIGAHTTAATTLVAA